MLVYERARPEDVDHVVDHMWARGHVEAANLGFAGRRVIRRRLHAFARTPFSYCIRVDGVPLLLVGGVEVEPGIVRTWFQATDEFERHGKAATKMLRIELRRWMAEHPDKILELVSASEHPDAPGWFRLLGFEIVGRQGLVSVYRARRVEN